jgi:hypothetical protein
MNRILRRSVIRTLVRSAGFLTIFSVASMARTQATTPKPVESASTLPSAAPAKGDPIQPAANGPDIALDPASLVPDLPPLPPAKASLIGGTIEHLDPIRDQIIIRVFGGGSMKALFDPRTHLYRDGKPASIEDLKPGQRIYADTILVNGTVFARNIRLNGSSPQGECQGVVLSYSPDRKTLVLRDLLSPAPMNLRLTSGTRFVRASQAASPDQLVAGTLVTVNFIPEPGNRPVARQVAILITPGTQFTFTGTVTTLDLHVGLLVVTSSADHKTYEVHFDPATLPVPPDLRDGAQVTVFTRYDGNQYVAQSLTVKRNSAD